MPQSLAANPKVPPKRKETRNVWSLTGEKKGRFVFGWKEIGEVDGSLCGLMWLFMMYRKGMCIICVNMTYDCMTNYVPNIFLPCMFPKVNGFSVPFVMMSQERRKTSVGN